MLEASALSMHDNARLLRSIAEQLKLPLTAIARQTELGRLTGEPSLVNMDAIRVHAEAALTLVDSYLLGLRLIQQQTTLDLEPVSLSSLLVETMHDLSDFAKQYNTHLELRIGGRYEPVMAHRVGLRAALLSLGYAMLESYPAQGNTMTLAVHRTPHGIVCGLYGQYEQLSAKEWRKALALQGRASQPLTAICAYSGAGLFVAEAILQAMESRLRVGKHLKQQGLAMTLQPSQQLQFV